mmetsp:Transcript_10703/g.16151  ORF Transcript_10703/g.16151 Transcript_10703/m.16151 type:complete len:292 (-) Transcript_10703:255-1130(-)
MIASKIASRVSRPIKQIPCQARRAQSTSTMALYSNTPCVERTTTLSDVQQNSASIEEKKQFSTSITPHDCQDLPEIVSHHTTGTSLNHSTALGFEISPEQAAAHSRPGTYFDKIMIFISHGETAEGSHATDINASLTGKGIGSALHISREIATYCNRNTGLVPDLYVTAPMRCANESALLAFPQYSPYSIHNRPWICHDKCSDVDLIASDPKCIDQLEADFPGIDYSILKNDRSGSSDFLSWLHEREDRIVVVSTTESWINDFFYSYVDTELNRDRVKNNKLFRMAGMKYN